MCCCASIKPDYLVIKFCLDFRKRTAPAATPTQPVNIFNVALKQTSSKFMKSSTCAKNTTTVGTKYIICYTNGYTQMNRYINRL